MQLLARMSGNPSASVANSPSVPRQQPDPTSNSSPAGLADTASEPTSGSSRGFILFAGGAAFLLYSSLLTRRSLVRRYQLGRPQFYQPNNAPYPPTNGFPDAVEAFGVATVYVCSAALMMTGGWMWALQVRNMQDLRLRLRSRIGGGARPGTNPKPEVEEEIEEWIAQILTRKAERDRRKRDGTSGS